MRTAQFIPPLAENIYYEINIVDPGETGMIGICLTEGNARLRDGDFTLWKKRSIGYFGNGKIHHNTDTPITSCKTFSTGDTVGCFVERLFVNENRLQFCFFTRNGKRLGPIILLNNKDFYPTIAMNSPGAIVKANLGESEFAWNIQGNE